ncbi:elongator complex protein 3 [Geobacter sp. AOG2]|uniref:elongator complex protein 3 n=1 Tax=Geobacter sp. AOG2 TaxID=1566347 RepID=UPI001CC5BA14|nr:radical SAM protein [Geobacter sp. AOG2]GFE61065.1 radical SAM protein [Geobacter sp. AOG2]
MEAVTVPFFISHQGCPHTCVFCDQHAISGSLGNLPDRQQIHAAIGSWHRSAAGRPLEVAFFGGSFTALPESVQDELLTSVRPLLESGIVGSIRVSTRPDYVDDSVVRRLAALGVAVIEIGVQSMDDDVLALSGRGHDSAASEAALRCIRRQGVAAGAQLMPGLPGDTSASALRSLERVIAAGATFVRLYPVVVLHGTELARRYQAGDYRPLSLEQGIALCKQLLHKAMRAGIDVIRIGLQAADGLNSATVLAGCWHPALGQLVRSELYFDLLSHLIAPLPDGVPFRVACHPSRLSDVIGQKRQNLVRLRPSGALIVVRPDDSLLEEEVMVEYSTQCFRSDIITGLNYTISEV